MDFKEVQEGELEVLQSIFMDDFEQVQTRTAWASVNAAHEFRVKIHAAEEDLKGLVSVKLHFKLPQRYPKIAPSFTTEDPISLTPDHLAGLTRHLTALLPSLLGTEMIYELCSAAANYISDRHKDVANPNRSLRDAALLRSEQEQKQQEEDMARAREVQEERNAREAARMAQLIEDDLRRKESLLPAPAESQDEDITVSDAGERSIKMRLGSRGGDDERWAKIKIGPAMDCDWLRNVFSAEVAVPSSMPEPVNLLVFDLLQDFFATPTGRRKLNKVTTELDRVRALRHANIVSILAHSVVPYSGALPPSHAARFIRRSRTGLSLIVLTPPLPMLKLSDLLHNAGTLHSTRCMQLFSQLLDGLDYLHSNNVVHRCLSLHSLYLQDNGLRIADIGWYKRIIDLNKSDPWVIEPEYHRVNEGWQCPEAIEDPFRYDKSRDVWDAGIILAQIACGSDVQSSYSSPAELLRKASLDPKLSQVLSEIFVDARRRPTANRLLISLRETSGSSNSPSTVSTPTARRPSKSSYFPPATPDSPLPVSRQKTVDTQTGLFWQPRPSGSRYRAEFEELEFLGRGGGGQVVKARNRLDGHLYAVKKIRLPEDRISETKILREVTIWSRMNHPNIVRYHTSWVETDEIIGDSDPETSTQTSSQVSSQPTLSMEQSRNGHATGATSDSDDDSDEAPTEFESDQEDHHATGEMDLDLGLEDMDFLSVSRSASVSYPSIHFGDEDDNQSRRSTRPSSRKQSPAESRALTRENTIEPTNTMTQQQRVVRTLYIQMEYVEKLTLKEAIEDGITEVDSWRLLFQILSAMLHFTSLNIIHRDLKPSNIFIDAKGDVRIGDFGLAVNQEVAEPVDPSLSVDLASDSNDLTSGVGTSLYIAPESLSRNKSEKAVKYSNKIDMYSLGIVFFEMWHQFKTGMERIHVLRDLRKAEIVFPPSWNRERLARQTKIVQACLVHDPEKRASPKDLLASDLLPPRVGDDSIEETIRLLSHSGTTHAQTLITALFNQTPEDRIRKDFSYDFYDGQGAKVDNDPFAEIVRDKLSKIFRQKGAVFMDSPLLMPQSEIYGTRKPVRLLDADGTIACLPFQLNIPFCRMVARDNSLTRLKRWTIAPVYRMTAGGGQPRAVLNAAFDIVSDAVTHAAEAECIFTLDEVMSTFPFAGQVYHYLNHARILDVVLSRVPERRRPQVLEILVQHGRLQRSWSKTAVELEKVSALTRAVIDDIGLFDVSGSLKSMRSRVLGIASPLKHLAVEAFEELERVVDLCTSMGVRNIRLAPLLATNWDFHENGIIFETHHIKGKVRDVVAAGGRFDHVVSRLTAPEVRFADRVPHVVGFSLAVAKLSLAAADANAAAAKVLASTRIDSQKTYGHWAIRRCDVYVASFSAGLIDSRLDVVKDLWKAGIKADVMYDDNFLNLTLDQIVSACRREGISWLVLVKGSPSHGHSHAHGSGHDSTKKSIYTSEVLKVKNVLRGWEEEVDRVDLPGWLHREMRDSMLGQAGDERHQHSLGLADGSDAVAPAGNSDTPRRAPQDIIPIIPELPVKKDDRQRSRHKQRALVMSKASANVEATAEAADRAPIFAVDIDGKAFERMVSTTDWLTNDKEFAKLRDAVEINKRDYISTVRQTILKHDARQSMSMFWLFSLREDRSCLVSRPHHHSQ